MSRASDEMPAGADGVWSMRQPPGSGAPSTWAWALGAALLVGAYLRLDQFVAQVLIDDEWHAVHQVIQRTPAAMFREFGYADYSIPLGILDWYESRWFGLSETAMRLPMMVCGLTTLVAMPLYVARRTSWSTAAVFAALLAISPLLVIYSRMARPYAITVLLGWIAHVAYQRYHAAPRWRPGAGAAYVGAAALAIWLHPIAAPFALAPQLWGLLELRRAEPRRRSARFARLLALALPTGAAVAALLLPPLHANPQALTAKGGIDMPNVATLVGALYMWLGTPSTAAVVLCIAIATLGARDIARAMPETRSAALGLALTMAAVMVTRPMWSFNSITFARYLLPLVPLVLLAVAAGTVRVAGWLAERIAASFAPPWRATIALVAATPVIALAVQSPLVPMLRHPNDQTLHLWYYFDFRPERHPYVPLLDVIPLSPFWASLGTLAPGSVRIAAAPFYFESYSWDAPRWERLARQAVVPGYLTGLCVDKRWGEVPRDPAFRFRNAVHLADDAALARKRIDYVVWQKPYLPAGAKDGAYVGADTAHCESALRAKFGPPAFEDTHLIAFRLPPTSEPAPDADR
jgi:hypothetical protein